MTSRVSLGRDALIRYVFERNFFELIPDFEYMRPNIENCKQAYKTELEKQGCSCRMTTAWAKPCVDQIMDAVEGAKKSNHELVRKFIRFVLQSPANMDVDHIGISVICERTYDIFVDKT